ncbi:polyketide synthase [Tahibacter harae]|uniref:Polyketide synthase n=1 Tax=Tahibacter harae TaxID=2963937 RepID=A0ABT1QM05_9GAMM|nr:polyketide synthase [Tahibacter harae]MCQ4163482.1 polyketide synthase [Tahibacter harae]
MQAEYMPSEEVTLHEVEDGVVQITMQDRASKNGFSPALMGGLLQAFKRIAANPAWRAVVLTGYDSYFASGGTQRVLMTLQEGTASFDSVNVYSLALDCEIPVISAMQGHGIGGGFVMGLYADFVLLSRESIYTANFMKYGFTPGMGATYILVQKLGVSLAHEMMLSAETYRGDALEKRGVPYAVLPRAQVLPRAIELARTVAAKPRKSLVALKNHLAAPLRQALPEIIRQEVAMHEATFRDADVRQRIETLFGQ